jgi:exonuclease SbcD
MKILASGDNHWCEHIRFEECKRVHAWTADFAREQKVDLFLDAGDIYERASTAIERAAAADWLEAMADVCPVVIAKGNHDRQKDVELLGRLKSRHPIIVEEQAAVHYVAGAAIAAIAWPNPAYMAALSNSRAETGAGVRDALQAVFRGLGAEIEQFDGPRIGLGHLMIDGSVTSTGQPLLGQPINVGLTDLALLNVSLGIAGHIHKHQHWSVNGAWWGYTGSPFRTDFGQLEDKVVLLAEFAGSDLMCVEAVKTPATPMIHLEGEWHGSDHGLEVVGTENAERLRGAEIRLRYDVEQDQRATARSAADALRDRLLAAGAVHVKVEEQVTVQTRARTPEIVAAVTLTDKLDIYWKSKGVDIEARRQQLHTKAHAIETRIRA